MRTASNLQSGRHTATRTVKHDVIVLLKNDHATVKKMFTRFGKLAKKQDIQGKADTANKICAELLSHTMAEEEIFYPGAREVTHDDDMLNEAVVEHESVKELIAQIQGMDPQDPMYDARMTVLGEYINHHILEEETEMFPEVREARALDLRELAVVFSARKQALMSQLCDQSGEINPRKLRTLAGMADHH